MKKLSLLLLVVSFMTSCVIPYIPPAQSNDNFEGVWQSLIDTNDIITISNGKIFWEALEESDTSYYDINDNLSDNYFIVPENFIGWDDHSMGQFKLVQKGLLNFIYKDQNNDYLGFIRKQ